MRKENRKNPGYFPSFYKYFDTRNIYPRLLIGSVAGLHLDFMAAAVRLKKKKDIYLTNTMFAESCLLLLPASASSEQPSSRPRGIRRGL